MTHIGRLAAIVLALAAAPSAADEPPTASPTASPAASPATAWDCLLGGADTARVAGDGGVTLERRGETLARGGVHLGFPFRAEAGGVACTADRLVVFAVSPGGAEHVLVHLRVEGSTLVVAPAPAAPAPGVPSGGGEADGAALCRAGRFDEGAALLRVAAETGMAAGPWLALGDCLWEAGDKGAAREAYRVYARRTPQRGWPRELSRRCPECEPVR